MIPVLGVVSAVIIAVYLTVFIRAEIRDRRYAADLASGFDRQLIWMGAVDTDGYFLDSFGNRTGRRLENFHPFD